MADRRLVYTVENRRDAGRGSRPQTARNVAQIAKSEATGGAASPMAARSSN